MKYAQWILIIFMIGCNQAAEVKEQPVEQSQAVIDTNKQSVTVVDYDKQLKDYSVLIEKYIKNAAKVKKGDVSALTECTSISLEAKEIEKELLKEAAKLTKGQQENLRVLYQQFEKVSSNIESTKK